MRPHLMELEDQAWFPPVLRNAMTDYLTFLAERAEAPLKGVAEVLEPALNSTGATTLIDLGSGGGGPSSMVQKILNRSRTSPLRLVLTDLYPNVDRLRLTSQHSDKTTIVENTVDATNVPTELQGFRTMFNSFHHLAPRLAEACLRDAVTQKQPIAIFEFVGRDLNGFLQMLFGVLTLIFAMPLVRPFRWTNLLFTYVIPVIPLCTVWDGVVSCWRVYTPSELKQFITKPGMQSFEWKMGKAKVFGLPIGPSYLIGIPRQS